MAKLNNFFSVGFFVLFPIVAQAQDSIVLRLPDLFESVFQYHPVIRQADLLPEHARFRLLAARGLFDPALNSVLDRKEFEGSHYFTVWNNELRVPTWFGFDLKAGYEFNNGQLLNPQNTVPDQGLFYVGISVPIGQGMVIDQRRAILRQAQIFTEIAEYERIILLNNTLLQISFEYWNWMYQHYRYRLYTRGYDLALERYGIVTERVAFGDLAPIDTVEASIEVQMRRQNMNQSRIDYVNSMLMLSNHLWGENNVPLEISDLFVPDMTLLDSVIDLKQIEKIIELSQEQHPLLQTYRRKLMQFDIERRYKADLLKPQLRIEFNALQHPLSFNEEGVNINRFENNYKIGASFNYPLLLRRQRGELKIVRLYIQETELELQQKSREVSNKIRAAYNELSNYRLLVNTQNNMVINYTILRDGEETRFRNGESSLFLINIRERQLIDSEIKFYELTSKLSFAKSKLTWEAGTLSEIYRDR
jgi:outer membrane protein TolC